MNREAIHQMTGLPDRAVVFVRFEGEARNKQCLPYFIAVDEHSKAVGEFSMPHVASITAAMEPHSIYHYCCLGTLTGLRLPPCSPVHTGDALPGGLHHRLSV